MNEATPDNGTPSIAVDQAGLYRIKIQGRLGTRLYERFDGMTVVEECNAAHIPFTILTGEVADQAALYGLVAAIRDLGLPLILVELVHPL